MYDSRQRSEQEMSKPKKIAQSSEEGHWLKILTFTFLIINFTLLLAPIHDSF